MFKQSTNKDIYIILDNVKYFKNLGPIFRIAEGFGIKKIFLCKENQEGLNHHQIQILKKSSRGTANRIEWDFANNSKEIIKKLKENGVFIAAIETDEKAELLQNSEFKLPVALVFGSENNGISIDTLKLCDTILKIKMTGTAKSINVASAVAIAAYEATRKLTD